jgi:hypothetical protein
MCAGQYIALRCLYLLKSSQKSSLDPILNLLNLLHTLEAHFPKMHNLSSKDGRMISFPMVFQLSCYNIVLISLSQSPLNNKRRDPVVCAKDPMFGTSLFLSIIFDKRTSHIHEWEEYQPEIVVWNVQWSVDPLLQTSVYIYMPPHGVVQSLFLSEWAVLDEDH